jgi:uncharacterized membrane protein YcfT
LAGVPANDLDAGSMRQVMAAEEPIRGATSTFQRVAWVDAAKGLAILLVVAHHSVMFLDATGLAPNPLVAANSALASLRMPLFFLASGLFAARPLASPWRTLLHKRVAFFGYLYLLWTVLRFAFFSVLPPGIDPDGSGDPALVLWAALVPGPSLWFLYALALFSVIGKALLRVPVPVALAASGVLSAFAGAGILEFDSFAWTFMARYLFFFLLGCHARQLVERLARAASPATVVLAAAACVGGAAAAVAFDLRSVLGVAFVLNVLAVTFGVLFAAEVSKVATASPLVALGRRTLPVYLLHVHWLALAMLGVRHLDLPVAVQYGAPAVLAVALTALSLLTHRLVTAAGAGWLFDLPPRWAHREPRQTAG